MREELWFQHSIPNCGKTWNGVGMATMLYKQKKQKDKQLKSYMKGHEQIGKKQQNKEGL